MTEPAAYVEWRGLVVPIYATAGAVIVHLADVPVRRTIEIEMATYPDG